MTDEAHKCCTPDSPRRCGTVLLGQIQINEQGGPEVQINDQSQSDGGPSKARLAVDAVDSSAARIIKVFIFDGHDESRLRDALKREAGICVKLLGAPMGEFVFTNALRMATRHLFHPRLSRSPVVGRESAARLVDRLITRIEDDGAIHRDALVDEIVAWSERAAAEILESANIKFERAVSALDTVV